MHNQDSEIVCFGEVLWDNLPHGCYPGGAPMNVAIHLFKMGIRSSIISKVGKDQLGADIIEFIAKQGVNISLIQEDVARETGMVQADTTDPLNVKYTIKTHVAYDFIDYNHSAKEAISKAKILLFGSLSVRNEASEKALMEYIKHANYCVFDVNLRSPHYSEEIIKKLLSHSDFVKMNEEELELIANWYGSEDSREQQMHMLADKLGIKTICVTLGAEGAMLLDEGTIYKNSGFEITVADTIGSGDSFLAAFLSQRLKNINAQESLQYACAVGAYVASQVSATPSINLEEIKALIS